MRTPYSTTQIAIACQETPDQIAATHPTWNEPNREDLRVHDIVMFFIPIDIRRPFLTSIIGPAAMGSGRRILSAISPLASFTRKSPLATAKELKPMPIRLAICSWSSGSPLVTGLDAVQDELGRRVKRGAESAGNAKLSLCRIFGASTTAVRFRY